MPAPENNTIITPDAIPEDIRQQAANKVVAQIEASTPTTQSNEADMQHHLGVSTDSNENQLLGLTTDEQRVLTFIKLHNPNDRIFLNWTNIFTLGELYYSNYTSEDYRAYQNKLKLLTAKYYNHKRYILQFDNTQIRAYAKDTSNKSNPHGIPQTKPIDTLDKPIFIDAQYEVQNGYTKISQMRVQLENNYKFLSGMPYVEPSDKKKFVKLRNNFIRTINAYYTHLYYFNRVNNHNMKEKEITLPQLAMAYSEATNEMLPRIDKVSIRLSENIITQKYDNEAAKLELFLQIKQKLQEQHMHPKDRKLQEELQKLIKDYIEFDKVYQTKLMNHITQRKNKKIISDMVILIGQPRPGDGAVTNPNEGMDDTAPSTTNLSAMAKQTGGKSSSLDNMDEGDRNRKFYFINKARRASGDF
jgi:hypothetical protein